MKPRNINQINLYIYFRLAQFLNTFLGERHCFFLLLLSLFFRFFCDAKSQVANMTVHDEANKHQQHGCGNGITRRGKAQCGITNSVMYWETNDVMFEWHFSFSHSHKSQLDL